MNKSPLTQVNERFESKQSLVDELTKMLSEPEDETRDEWKSRLLKTPNAKLLRLHRQATDIEQRFGDREALLDSLCSLKFAGRAVEDAWRTKASGWSNGRLLDLHGSLAGKTTPTVST